MTTFSRRHFFLVLGASCLPGCTTVPASTSDLPIVRTVTVTGRKNLWISTAAGYVHRHMVELLGNHYQPQANNGAVLMIELTGISFPYSGGGKSFSLDSSDSLEGRVRIILASGKTLKEFPVFASVISVDAAPEIQNPTVNRYNWISRAFAQAVLREFL